MGPSRTIMDHLGIQNGWFTQPIWGLKKSGSGHSWWVEAMSICGRHIKLRPKMSLGNAGKLLLGIKNLSPIAVPSGKCLRNYGTSPFSIGKSTISMVIFQFANCWHNQRASFDVDDVDHPQNWAQFLRFLGDPSTAKCDPWSPGITISMAMQQEPINIGGTHHICLAYSLGLCKRISCQSWSLKSLKVFLLLGSLWSSWFHDGPKAMKRGVLKMQILTTVNPGENTASRRWNLLR